MTTVCHRLSTFCVFRDLVRKFCERLAKVSRKSRESSHVQSPWGSPFNKCDQHNSQELARNEANQAHAKIISRKKKTRACMSSHPIFLPKYTSNISIHFHSFHAGAFFVSPYNEQRKAPLGLRYTTPLSPRKGRESSCLPMCSAKAKTVVAKATRKFSRRYVASITKSKRSFFQSSNGVIIQPLNKWPKNTWVTYGEIRVTKK